jgi:hypothetical protein
MAAWKFMFYEDECSHVIESRESGPNLEIAYMIAILLPCSHDGDAVQHKPCTQKWSLEMLKCLTYAWNCHRSTMRSPPNPQQERPQGSQEQAKAKLNTAHQQRQGLMAWALLLTLI